MAKKEAKSNKDKKHFFKDFKAEIKKVIWPTPKQLLNSTVAIITMVLVVALIVFCLDVVFDMLNKHALTSLQEVVQTIDDGDSVNTDEEPSVDENNTSNEAASEAQSQESENQEKNAEANE